MKNPLIYSVLLSAVFFTYTTCKKKDITPCLEPPAVLSVSQDKELGAQVAAQIDATPSEYPVLDPSQYASSYTYLNNMRDEILKSSKFKHKSDFEWRLRIIKDDNTLNAFCTPGGYIYIYTGIIKYLDTPDDLAGVLGHEMGHADLRHSIISLQNEYATSFLISLLTGGTAQQLLGVANSLRSLKNSRCHETQADDASVNFLAGSIYKCNGAASFFEKIQAAGGSSTPVFLSTHPDPGKRVENINNKAKDLSCNTTASSASQSAYLDFKNSLP